MATSIKRALIEAQMAYLNSQDRRVHVIVDLAVLDRTKGVLPMDRTIDGNKESSAIVVNITMNPKIGSNAVFEFVLDDVAMSFKTSYNKQLITCYIPIPAILSVFEPTVGGPAATFDVEADYKYWLDRNPTPPKKKAKLSVVK